MSLRPDTHLCTGCDTTFTLRGYQSHLLQTKNPLCRAVFDGLKKSYETFQLLEKAASSSDEDMEDINKIQIDISMEGDSDEENWEGLRSDDEEHHEEDSELEDVGNMNADWETGWEQDRDGAPQDGGENELADIHSDEEESHSDNLNDHRQQNFDRYIIGDGYRVKPAVRILYTEKYPSSRAGKPLSHGESRDSVYITSLGGGDNPWAPFHSKKDWEVARWAKLRGVGSTAFSDLVAIDGVGFSRNFLAIFPLKFMF